MVSATRPGERPDSERGAPPAIGTRRATVLGLLREAAEPLGVAAVARHLGLHENTARFHLDGLVAAGLAERGLAPRATRGRPAAEYRAAPPAEPESPRGYRLLAEILARSWSRWVPAPEAAAVSSGEEWGRYLVGRPTPYARLDRDAAIGRLTTLLDDLGFAPGLESHPEGIQIMLRDCPFRGAAVEDREVVCGIHLGLMRGALRELAADVEVTRLDPMVEPLLCIASLSADAGSAAPGAAIQWTPNVPTRRPAREEPSMAVVPYRRLFGPGPCNAYPEALIALQQPVLGHLDPAFIEMTDRVCDGLRTVWGTSNRYTMPMSGTGMSGMEAAFANIVVPGDVVVVAVNGLFAERQVDLAERMGAQVVRVDFPWGQPIDPEAVATAHPNPKVISAVHAETSTGVRSDLAALGRLKGDALLLMDAVTSLGGIEVAVDDWGVDIAYSGTQKCLGTPPGLAPFTMSERAYERRNPRPHSFYLDVTLMGAYVGAAQGPVRAYHHTASSPLYASLDATLRRLADEGLPNVWARHQVAGDHFQAGLQDMGLELFAAEGSRLPELTTIKVPEGVDSARVRAFLLSEYDIEIGAGVKDLASKVWRVGLMGANANMASVTLLLGALQDALKRA